MGVIFDALRAGIQVEMKIVSAENRTQRPKSPQEMTTRSPETSLKIEKSMGLMNKKVIPMPPSPQIIPTGILTAPMRAPSKKTELRFWERVAPTLESIPKYRERSATEMAKAL